MSRTGIIHPPADLPANEHDFPGSVARPDQATFWANFWRHGAWLGLLGLAIATALAVPDRHLAGLEQVREPGAFRVPIEFLRPIPSAVLSLLLFLTLGSTLRSEVFLAAFGAFWPLLVQTMYGVRDTDPLLADTGRSFGVGRLERLCRMTLPERNPVHATGCGSRPRSH